MERDRQPRLRPFERIRTVGRFVSERMLCTGTDTGWPRSQQRDVGKSRHHAQDVQLVIEGLQAYAPSPIIERTDSEQLDRTMQNRWDDMGTYLDRDEDGRERFDVV